jgi:hypothetical protein
MNNLLKEAYIEAVIKYLPLSQREDIKKELDSLIEDSMENEGKSIEEVLADLGQPKKFAYQYLDESFYVIGPRYKESYYNMLKTLIPLVWLIIIVLNVLSIIFTGDYNNGDILSGVFNSTFVVFTYVTVGFILAEKFINKDKTEDWHPSQLNTDKLTQKSWPKSESYIGIVFVLSFMVLLNNFPHIIGINDVGTGDNIPFLNIDGLDTYLILMNIGLISAATRLFVRIFMPYYNKVSCSISIGLHFISALLFIIVFVDKDLLNPNLTSQIQAMNFPEFINFDFIHSLFLVMAGIVFIVFALDTFKEVKYGILKK